MRRSDNTPIGKANAIDAGFNVAIPRITRPHIAAHQTLIYRCPVGQLFSAPWSAHLGNSRSTTSMLLSLHPKLTWSVGGMLASL